MQRIKLDINPKGEIPVLYVSQCDKGRSFEVELVDGEQAYNVPSGYSVQLNVRKTDSKLVTKAPDSIDDNILTFSTTEQMTACAGENIASVTLKDSDDIVITSLYFLISVQRDVLAGGLESASEIHNLEQQIAAIVPEVIGDDYYNKSETDTLLADKANRSELSDLASKAELEYAINEEDTDIRNWAITNFATPGYIASNYYNKYQVINLLSNMLPVGNASGNPCTFETEIEAALQALTAEIIASGGGGTPDNPIPIVGHSELNLTRCGKNLLDKTTGILQDMYINQSTMKIANIGATGASIYCPIVGNNTYTVSKVSSARFAIATTKVIPALGVDVFDYVSNNTATSLTLTANADAKYLIIFFYISIYDTETQSEILDTIQAELGSTATAYEPYNGDTFTVAFGQTVYGGVYDKSGRLTPCVYYHSYNGETLSGSWLSSEAVYSEGTTPPIGSQVVSLEDYSTPFDVPSISVSAVVGTNNIISDCNGDVNVSYKDSIQHYIDTRL